jgi:hypothetical protein
MENVKGNLISIGQLSRKLGISIVWLKAQADKGVLPCINAGGKLLFNFQAVNSKLAELAAKGGHNES